MHPADTHIRIAHMYPADAWLAGYEDGKDGATRREDEAGALLQTYLAGYTAATAAYIATLSAEDAYAAGYHDRQAAVPRRSHANDSIAGVDYDLGWRDAAPGGHGWRT